MIAETDMIDLTDDGDCRVVPTSSGLLAMTFLFIRFSFFLFLFRS